ncbi:MAG: putative ABC transport system permease protein [Microgenomates group bacterium Gr01-1014_7]|nr:MAG: putative ABC transport system permease protein [Microgenomates group bacterium Gr01-1014_7]
METMNKFLASPVNTALTAIFANRMRSFLTVLGIVIGVTSVILLISLVTGLKTYITSQIEGLGSNLLFVIPGRIGGARSPGGVQANRLVYPDAVNLRTKLTDQAQVSAAIQRNATLKYGNKKDEGAAVFGVEANYPDIISLKITDGRFFRESESRSARKVAVVGTTVRDSLFGQGRIIGEQLDVAGSRYTVLGALGPRGSVFGIDFDNSIYIPFSTAQKQFGIDRLNTIYVSANSPENVKEVQTKAINILKKRLSEDEFTVQSQEQALSTISQITGVLTAALGGIATISLIVGGIGVMNIMLVSVTERTREIGLRKAVGAKPSDIRNQFLIEAMTLSGIGGIIGIILGILISFIIGRFFTTTVPIWSVALAFGFSMLVGVIFGVAPAIRASRLNPIQALRYE